MEILDTMISESGFVGLNWPHLLMMLVGGGLVFFSLRRKHQPTLLVPLGFAMFLSNLPAAMMHVTVGDPTGSHGVGLVQLIYNALIKNEVLPPIIFLGLGARANLRPLLQRPSLLVLGVATQLAILAGAATAQHLFGFPLASSLALGLVGPADGVSTIYLSAILAPKLLGVVILTMLLIHFLLPTLIPLCLRFLAGAGARTMPLAPGAQVSRRASVLFPLALALLTMMLAPNAAPLVGMMMMGNLLREAGGPQGLARGVGGPLLDIATAVLGLTVGATMTGRTLMKMQTLKVMGTGLLGMMVALLVGLLLVRVINMALPAERKLNPCLGAAAVGGPPTAARVVSDYLGGGEDMRHAAEAVNMVAVISAATAAGLFLGFLR